MMITKNISKQILLLAAVCTFGLGCKDKLDFLPSQPLENYVKVYMPQAVLPPALKSLKITDSVQTLTYGAVLGGKDFATADLPITFKVNKAVVDSFNLANKTSYPVLPDGSYTLSSATATIAKGGVSTSPLSIALKTNGSGAMDALKVYVLPVSIASSPVKVNEALRTTFYIIKAQPDFANYPNYDRSTWKILSFSSQEANGEGPTNGRAIFALDGSTATFWHTQWSGASPVPPHFLTIDLGEAKIIHGLSFVGRQADAGGKPNEVNVQVSQDNITWTNAGTFNLLNNKDLQKQFLADGFKTARYLKVIINSAYNGSFTQVAELNAF